MRPVAIGAAAALALAVVLGAVLVFQPDAATSSGVLQWLTRRVADLGVPYRQAVGVLEFGLNIALFVPGALAAALLWPGVRWWQWVFVGLAVSAGVEGVQGALLPGREAQAHDLLSNTTGAALGAGAAVVLRRRSGHGSRASPI